jgi:hemerythrin-like domain-containing protein
VKATDVLTAEHRVIEQVLDCLEKMAQRGLAEGRLDGLSAERAVAFFEVFADQCHHDKEEQHLFPALEARGFPRQGGPTGVMRAEHEEGRRLIRAIAGLVGPASGGDRQALEDFAARARAYCGLLRDHIHKEDRCLFPMAAQALRDDEQQALLKAFDGLEHDDLHAGTHETFLRVADELARRFGVQPAAAETAAVSCGCGHHAPHSRED